MHPCSEGIDEGRGGQDEEEQQKPEGRWRQSPTRWRSEHKSLRVLVGQGAAGISGARRRWQPEPERESERRGEDELVAGACGGSGGEQHEVGEDAQQERVVIRCRAGLKKTLGQSERDGGLRRLPVKRRCRIQTDRRFMCSVDVASNGWYLEDDVALCIVRFPSGFHIIEKFQIARNFRA